MYVKSVEDKMVEALKTNPVILHADFLKTLDFQEQRGLLDTMRDMEKRKLIKRDVSEIVDGKLVLKYLKVTG